VGVIKALLRVYSYVFGGLLALFLLGISSLALANGTPLNLAFLPWSGRSLNYWVLGLALFGLLTLLMAMGGKLRALFFLWSLAAFVLLFKGLFISFYAFSGPLPFRAAVWLTAGSLVATLGSFPWSRERGPVRRPQRY
jgi:hypothetical protein